jgi:hypothetical protein
MSRSSLAYAAPDDSKPLVLVALVWGVVCLGLLIHAYANESRHPPRQSVYPLFSQAGRDWLRGADAYRLEHFESSPGPNEIVAYRYAPLISALFVPFSVLPDPLGGVLWRLLSYIAFLAAVTCLLARLGGLQHSWTAPATPPWTAPRLACFWLLLLPFSIPSMNNGQANVLMMAALVAAATLAIDQRWNVCALLLAFACILKVYPVAIALLFILLYPRQLGPRFLAAMVLGLLLPFYLQHSNYVAQQYVNWYRLFLVDDRSAMRLDLTYRDALLLVRWLELPLAKTAYWAIALAAAITTAAIPILGRRRGWPEAQRVMTTLSLGCAWLAVFAPAMESCTFILLASAIAYAMLCDV